VPEVSEASKDCWVVVLLHQDKCAASTHWQAWDCHERGFLKHSSVYYFLQKLKSSNWHAGKADEAL